MKALVQRVSSARVSVDGREVSSIGPGMLVLLGVEKGDGKAEARFLSRKIANLRIFQDAEGKMNLSLLDTAGSALVVSQFTLAGNVRKGNRPSFERAELPERAKELYLLFVEMLRGEGVPVSEGVFQAHMNVSLVNDGPVTLMLESPQSGKW